MDIVTCTNMLADAVRNCDLSSEYARLQKIVLSDDTNRALLKEYKRLQWGLQMQTIYGNQASHEEMSRFSQLSTLLYMNSDVQAYLLIEMKLQKMLADVIKQITDAAGVQLDLPAI